MPLTREMRPQLSRVMERGLMNEVLDATEAKLLIFDVMMYDLRFTFTWMPNVVSSSQVNSIVSRSKSGPKA
jgi:hypothetical protein